MDYYIDFVYGKIWKDIHNILLNKTQIVLQCKEYNLITIGMYNFRCIKTYGIIYSSGFLRTYTFYIYVSCFVLFCVCCLKFF